LTQVHTLTKSWRPGHLFSAFFLRVAFAHEIANRAVCGGQRLFIGQETIRKCFRPGTLAESGAVHDRHVFLANEFGDEDVVVFRDIDARVGVKKAPRGGTQLTREVFRRTNSWSDRAGLRSCASLRQGDPAGLRAPV